MIARTTISSTGVKPAALGWLLSTIGDRDVLFGFRRGGRSGLRSCLKRCRHQLGEHELVLINGLDRYHEDGQTIVIGGIMENSNLERSEGVPFFKDIPFVGHFFTNSQDELRATELIILMTPRVVDPWAVRDAPESVRVAVPSVGRSDGPGENPKADPMY